MTNSYLQLKNRHQAEVNNFPIAFAFSEKQFEEGMRSLGLEPHETDQVVDVGLGGFILKTDVVAYKEMFVRHDEEMQAAIDSSDQFVFDMFNYELANHEYTYTYSVGDTLRALGLTYEQVQNDERLSNGLEKACVYQRENAC